VERKVGSSCHDDTIDALEQAMPPNGTETEPEHAGQRAGRIELPLDVHIASPPRSVHIVLPLPMDTGISCGWRVDYVYAGCTGQLAALVTGQRDELVGDLVALVPSSQTDVTFELKPISIEMSSSPISNSRNWKKCGYTFPSMSFRPNPFGCFSSEWRRPWACCRQRRSSSSKLSERDGAESSRPASLLSTLRTHQSPGEWQNSLLTCLLDFNQAGFTPAG
jgi:hypothetical protein